LLAADVFNKAETSNSVRTYCSIDADAGILPVVVDLDVISEPSIDPITF
jgi:hypothetical protein